MYITKPVMCYQYFSNLLIFKVKSYIGQFGNYLCVKVQHYKLQHFPFIKDLFEDLMPSFGLVKNSVELECTIIRPVNLATV